MSNNNNSNPHGHANQPPAQNPSWNPLQIPSYIPRQPQLAHMSNERPMVRSPLAWHAPAPPPDSIYNFMSANHKNLDHQMNPLLPPYVRGPSPFDSMDLSVQSSRSSNSPLNKSGVPQQQQHSVLPHDYVHKQHQQSQQHTHQQQQQQQQHQQQSQMHAPNSYSIHLPTSSPHSVSHAQSHQQQQQHQHRQQAQQLQTHPSGLNPHGMQQSGSAAGASTSAKYLSSNGGDCEMLPPSLGHGGSSGPGPASVGGNPSGSSSAISGDPTAHYMRESEAHMQDNYAKMTNLNINRNYDNELQGKPTHKPVELVSKDCNYTMPSNKMPQQQQQGSPKKHSPLRNYHHTHTQQQQQQQQQQHYNSPHTHTVSHNGPQTPPTPQSPVNQQQQTPTASHANPTATTTMQQLGDSRIMQTTSNIMDYNQLHLQHNNSYATLTHQQQLPTAQQPSPLHHQQQQQQQKQQAHHPHFGTHMQRQQQLQQQPLPLPPQLQQIQHHQTHQHHHHQQTTPPTLTNLDAYAAQQSNSKMKEHDVVKSTMPELTPATPPPPRAAAAAHLRGQPLSNASSFPIRSSSPDNAVTSNEDSVDSNSNSSRARRKRKPSKLSRTSSNESENEDEAPGSASMNLLSASAEDNTAKHQNVLEQDPKSLSHRTVINKSPSQTQDLQHISPRKANTNSPSQLELARSSQLASSADTASVAITQRQRSSSDDSENDKQTMENGRTAAPPLTPHKSDNDTDVETIDKIAEMIAKTASGSQEVHNSNSSSSSRSVSNIGSPKTKKQRQALKLRNTEQQNSNSNFSTNSNSYSESLPDHGGAANDNAVLAEELRKEPASSSIVDLVCKNTKTDIISPLASETVDAGSSLATTKPRPLSPPNYSRSCSSSSSSSSSCSNSSHSSSPSKDNKLKNPLELTPSKTEVTVLTHGMTVEKQHNIKSDVLGDGIEAASAKTPKNEEFKSEDGEGCKPLKLLVERCLENKNELLKSPTKSCFEEVENKLEEMFAGIEDEPPAAIPDENVFPAPSNVSEVANDLSLALELSTPVPTVKQQTSIKLKELKEPTTEAGSSPCPNIQIDKAPPTKAAKKSTLPSPVKSSSTALLRTTPPRRRLSVLIEPANLKLLQLAEKARISNSPALPDTPVDERPSTSAAAAAASAAAMASKATKEMFSNESKNSAPVKKKQNKTKGAKKSIAASKTKSCVKAPKGKKNNKNQQKKHKGKQQNSDDEHAPPLREANGAGQTAVANADSRYKSPYILVKRDGSVSVINAPTAEDLGAEKQTKVKKAAGHHRGYVQDRKNLRGMHSSTLSNKYDADTADKTWICVFCKRGPHRMGLGDLFGPYLVSTNCEEYKTAVKAPGALDLDAVMLNKRRRMDMVQTHPRNLPVVPAVGGGGGALHAASTLNRLGGNNKKKKKSAEESTVAVDPLVLANIESDEQEDIETKLGGGMCKVTDTTYEVWLHEDCAVWAPSVFLVGARVMGLDAAVWNSTCYQCVLCAKAGAMICCLQRECSVAAHVPCARESQWSLNEDDFKVFCQNHATHNTRTATTTAEAASELLGNTTNVPSSSVLAALLNRPPAKPTSSNIHALHRS